MQVYMEEKPKKAFISMNKSIIFIFLLLVVSACEKNQPNPEPIDDVPVNITINLALPQYEKLLQTGQFVYESGGLRGVVVVHHFDNRYYAFERTCPYQPRNACSQIEMDSSLFLFRCGETSNGNFNKCCDSRFSTDGEVFSGPANFGLKHYIITQNGNLLNIKN